MEKVLDEAIKPVAVGKMYCPVLNLKSLGGNERAVSYNGATGLGNVSNLPAERTFTKYDMTSDSMIMENPDGSDLYLMAPVTRFFNDLLRLKINNGRIEGNSVLIEGINQPSSEGAGIGIIAEEELSSSTVLKVTSIVSPISVRVGDIMFMNSHIYVYLGEYDTLTAYNRRSGNDFVYQTGGRYMYLLNVKTKTVSSVTNLNYIQKLEGVTISLTPHECFAIAFIHGLDQLPYKGNYKLGMGELDTKSLVGRYSSFGSSHTVGVAGAGETLVFKRQGPTGGTVNAAYIQSQFIKKFILW